jgi:hypothetical protein
MGHVEALLASQGLDRGGPNRTVQVTVQLGLAPAPEIYDP